MVKYICRVPFQFWLQFDAYKVKINKLLRVRRKLCMMINLPPSAKLSSFQWVETLEFQAYCIICNEFATSVEKSLHMFVSSVNNFSWANLCFLFEGGSLGGWWKAFKPFCFEHQTACLKIYSEWEVKSTEWEERKKERDTDMRSTRQGVRWMILKSSRGAALQEQIRTIPKCQGSFEKKLNLTQKGHL